MKIVKIKILFHNSASIYFLRRHAFCKKKKKKLFLQQQQR
jgi:hypothetical protein